MSFSRGRRPELEYQRPLSVVPTKFERPRSAARGPQRSPIKAPLGEGASEVPAVITGPLRNKGGQFDRWNAEKPPAVPPWALSGPADADPLLKSSKRPSTARARLRPRSASAPAPPDAARRVPDRYRRTRFTLRARAGAGVEGVARCLAAFEAFDKRGRGDVTRADFMRALRGTLQVPLSERQLRETAEDCAASVSEPDGKFARVDYCLFLRRCFPAETEELGLLTSDDRDAFEGDAASAAATKAASTPPAERGAGDDDVATAASSPADPLGRSLSPGAEGVIAGVRNIGIAHETIYPTRSGTREYFGKTTSDVTSKTLEGRPKHKIPEELAHEPPLNLFHGRGMENPRPLTAVPHRERAMMAIRTKLRERLTSARSSGTGIRTLKKTILAPFAPPHPDRLGFPEFKRAMISMNVNLRREHLAALFDYYAETDGRVPVDAFCHQVVHGESAEEYAGGAPAFDGALPLPPPGSRPHSADPRGPRSPDAGGWARFDSDSDSDASEAERRAHALGGTDITKIGVLDGTPRRVLPPGRPRDPPLNVFAHGAASRANTSGATSRFSPMKTSTGYDARRDPDERVAMRYLRQLLSQRIGRCNGGDGAFLLRKSLMRQTGRETLSREEFLDAIEHMGLNLPVERQYEALYEGHCNLTGTVDVDAFCRAVVDY